MCTWLKVMCVSSPPARWSPVHDGLDDMRVIIAAGAAAPQCRGWLMLEHGYDQAPAVRDLLLAQGFEEVESRIDLGGHERITLGRLPC
jgi:release factor glutamine methyltransferase